MERGSEKHGPRVDEEMGNETRGLEQGAPVEPRVEEFREQEAAADGEPEPDARIAGGRDTGGTLSPEEVEARSELARSIEPSAFPADRRALLRTAQNINAPDSVINRLRNLPSNVEFENVQAVWSALGGSVEQGA